MPQGFDGIHAVATVWHWLCQCSRVFSVFLGSDETAVYTGRASASHLQE